MKWKEFLKHNRKKDIVFGLIILFQSLLYLGYCSSEKTNLVPMTSGNKALSEQCESILFATWWPVAIMTVKLSIIGLIPGLVIFILYTYLLSCLIVWIYDKFRKVKKK